MDFNVHSPDGALIGIVESPASAIWTRRYQKPGDFELHFPATAEALGMITDDCYITREDAPEIMIVEHVELLTDEEEGDYILITGRGAECLLERRIVWTQTRLSGRVDAAIMRLIVENAISPTDPDRALPILMETPDLLTMTISAQYTGTNLLEAVQEICKAYGLGFRAVVDNYALVTPIIELLDGSDHSEGQTLNSPVVFSAEYENLLSSSYVLDTTNYKNVALVAGEGEGLARKRVSYGSASGMTRRELYVDARDMSTNEGEITEDEYTAQLAARGAEAIGEHTVTEAFDGEIDTSNTFVLDEDYTVGDIVTVENEYGIRKNVRVASVMECWDDQGYSAIPTYENVEV